MSLVIMRKLKIILHPKLRFNIACNVKLKILQTPILTESEISGLLLEKELQEFPNDIQREISRNHGLLG